MTATNSHGVESASQVVEVVDVPIAGLTASNDSPTELGSTTTFSATITAGTNVSYIWKFGDGTTAVGAEVTHAYAQIGNYTATVTATNSHGVESASQVVEVVDVPIAGLTASNDSPTLLGSATTFTATITAGTNVTYTWEFGDGAIASGVMLTHTYAAVGDYTVLLTATNPRGVVTTTTTASITQTMLSWPISIEGTWNFISLPLVPATSYTANKWCEEINNQGSSVVEIDRWDQGGWEGHLCEFSFNHFPIEMGKGYFIRANAASSWNVQGYAVTSAVPLNLQAGWNSISIPHTDSYTAKSLCNDFINQGITAVEIDRWYIGGWQGHVCGLPFNNFAIQRGVGYFVKTTSAGTVTPSAPASSRRPQEVLLSPDEVPTGPRLPIRNLRLSNLRESSVTLSWITDEVTTGYVRFGKTNDKLEQTSYDSRGSATSSTTHYITLNKLTPETTYYFEIISGDEVADTGTLTTTSSLDSLPESDTIYGQIFKADGTTPAADSLVYLTLRDQDGEGSQGEAMLLSAIVDNEGYWHANLGNTRITNGKEQFIYSETEDTVVLTVQSTTGETSMVQSSSELHPALPLTLKEKEAWSLYLPLIEN